MLTMIREILECDKSKCGTFFCSDNRMKSRVLLFFLSPKETRRPLVKVLIKNDACSFLLHNLRAVADDRGLGQEISLQIHQILAIIGHHGS